MRDWLRRLRGVLGLGTVGGVAGALFGAVWWLLAPILGIAGLVIGDVWSTATVWGFCGAFAASGAGLLLSALGTRRSLQQLSPWRVAAFGAVMGLLAPSAFLVLVTGSFWGPYMSLFATISGMVGGALGGGIVLIAQGAPPDELGPGRSEALGPGEAGDG